MIDPAAHQRDGIAIIGMSGRFPGAATLEQYWSNLYGGVESVTFFTDEELLAAGVSEAVVRDPQYVKARSVLAGVESFDAKFFGFSPREADITDPQQRMFLECAWEALEVAAHDPARCPGKIGVFAGVSWSTYLFDLMSRPDVWSAMGGFQIAIGNEKDHLTTRVAYKLNLRGPSVTVQTACSSSLVALCLACDSLTAGHCDLALAGGASISFPQTAGYFYEEGGILSPDGRCRAFDAAAHGTLGGSGVGVVVVRRLADAIADGDNIRAVIRGWATNNDGSRKVGYTAPSVEGQADVIATAQARGGITSDTITYVEAHGTGTTLGDPIEAAALIEAFRRGTSRTGFCALGSVKTNIGHLDAAAGMAGLIKTVLALEHKELPPSLHYRDPNPAIPFAESPFYVNAALQPWPSHSLPRRAGVSSFGIGGTNAHVVVEEAPVQPASGPSRELSLIVLSARTATALDRTTANLAGHLEATRDASLPDIAYTLQVGRGNMLHRRMLVCAGSGDAVNILRGRVPERLHTTVTPPHPRPLAFLFPGQGSQFAGMTSGLYEAEPVFRAHVDALMKGLEPALANELRTLMYAPATSGDPTSRLDDTINAQPALFIVEYALARLLMEWGAQPDAFLGHSVGEFTAACLADVFTSEDALSLVVKRARLMQALPPGRMLAVASSESSLRAVVGGQVDVAAINGPGLTVLSGPVRAIEALERQLRAQSIQFRALSTSHAFHSATMDPIVERFTEEVARVRRYAPRIPLVSNVTGTWMDPTTATDPAYWGSHVRRTVLFAQGVGELLAEEDRILLEVGPGRSLSTLAAGHQSRTPNHVIATCGRHPHDSQSDQAALLNAVGRLWLSGVPVDWTAFSARERRRRVTLPTYPFERQRHWIDSSPAPAEQMSPPPPDDPRPARGQVATWTYLPSWRRRPIAPAALAKTEPKTWLVFADEHGCAEAVSKRLRAAGHEVTSVREGHTIERIGESEYSLPFADAASYASLFDELSASDRVPAAIAHFWSVQPAAPSERFDRRFEAAQQRGLHSLLCLSRSARAADGAATLPIFVFATNLFDVLGGDVVRAERASLLGACGVIPQERPGLRCHVIDLPGEDLSVDLLDAVASELAADHPEPVVAFRGAHRWVRAFERWPLDAPAPELSLLRQDGCYLITGGRGRIGFVIARHLARTARANLVLVGRSALPGRDEYDSWLADRNPEDPIALELRRILALEHLGSQVMSVTADAADTTAMQHAIAEARTRFGRIDGVIHAAGLTAEWGFRPVEETDQALCNAHHRPKAVALDTLRALLADDPPDFWMLTSSLSAVLGGLGMAGYAAANAVLDAYATEQRRDGKGEWTSVNWDGWDFSETERAMDDQRPGLSPQEGVDVLARVLTRGMPAQVIVSTTDLDTRFDQWVAMRGGQRRAPSAAPIGRAPVPPSRDAALASSDADGVGGLVMQMWQELLGIDAISQHDNFFDLGGHSLLAIQLISRMRNTFGVELSVHRVFERPTIAGLSDLVTSERPQTEDARLEEMLTLVEGLSDEEIRVLLASDERAGSVEGT